ncbi:MAG: pirin family protein [Anaerolineales bacterium]|nr:pirin family protein [Anaerolineales bacterium]
MKPRIVNATYTPQAVVDGAGVKLKRCMPTPNLDYLDPFLLLDQFGSNDPHDYLAGFPMHPHRGIETITYIIEGEMHHKDSQGNTGKIGKGELQWITCGRGLIHEEMPRSRVGKMLGFHFWINMPGNMKMTPPVYREIRAADIPEITGEEGFRVKVIAGEYEDKIGPIAEIAANPLILDVALPQETSFSCPVRPSQTAFIYAYVGGGFAPQKYDDVKITALKCAEFRDGETIDIRTEETAIRFLLMAADPLEEPIARHEAIVMNTADEIEQALFEIKSGLFVS